MIIEANLFWRYREGEIIMPWYTRPALEFIAAQNWQGKKVFEYGTGYSSIWWRSKNVDYEAIDHSREWANAFGVGYTTNKVRYVEASELARWGEDPADVIVVDGEYRRDCIDFVLSSVAEGKLMRKAGLFIIDNFEFFGDEGKHEIIERINAMGCWERHSFPQPGHSAWTTEIFKLV